MATTDPETPAVELELERARDRIAERSFPAEPDAGSAAVETVGLIGLEPEMFPYRIDAKGRPAGRLPLARDARGPGSIEILAKAADAVDELRAVDPAPGKPPEFVFANGGRLTFEPGGQIEHSTAPYATGAAAQTDTTDVLCLLKETFAAHNVVLASTGIDLFETQESVAQQLDAPRYRAMAAYLASRGPHGATMMRLTASRQLNLDTGTGRTLEERWLVAQLLSPVITAAFSSSTRDGWHNARARAWLELDPTRSGFPAKLVDGSSDDPREQFTEAALDADVLLFRTPEGGALPGRPGFRFRDWLRDGHPEVGKPTLDDLDYHLTTLFFEVRARGFFELRACDALPAPFSTAPEVLVTSILYDAQARGAVLERLEPWRASLPELAHRAARAGLADPELGPACAGVLELGLEGAHRMPVGWFSIQNLETAERFLEGFTRKHLAPAHALCAALRRGPAEALQWAAGEVDCARTWAKTLEPDTGARRA